MPLVPNNSIVTYVATFAPGVGYNQQTAQAAITAKLTSVGMTVLAATQSGEGFFSIGTEPITFTMQVKVQTGFDYSSEDDVASIINHIIYEIFNILPAASIPRFQPPSGGQTATGQPDPGKTSPKQSGCIAGSSSDLSGSFSLGCWFSNLTTKGLSTFGILGIIIAVGIGIFVFAPRPRLSAG